MPRLLQLAFETPPHPDAVCHSATADDVRFALELLSSPGPHRWQLASRLRRSLVLQAGIAPWSRPGVPCHRPSGLYAIVPWRFAKWLAAVLPASDGEIERMTARLQHWLSERRGASALAPSPPSSGERGPEKTIRPCGCLRISKHEVSRNIFPQGKEPQS